MTRQSKLLTWELVNIVWIACAGSLLHFAFELSDYWTPMALLAAVNESAWEHTKMYFWPGLAFAVAQFTYTRNIANNYWFGKAVGLALTPIIIFVSYFGYLAYMESVGTKPSLAMMIGVMLFGIAAGQLACWKILCMEPLTFRTARYATALYAGLVLMFSSFTYFPPKTFVFENFFCYEYTGEYGILDDYEPYRVFTAVSTDGEALDGGGVNYCESRYGRDSSTDLASR